MPESPSRDHGSPQFNGSTRPALARLRQGESEIKALVHDNAQLRSGARRIFGVSGRWERVPMGPAARATHASWFAVATLCILTFVDVADSAVLVLGRPQMQISIGPGTLGQMPWLRPVLAGGGALATLALRNRIRVKRATVARLAAALGGLGVLGAGFSTSGFVALLAAALVWIASGSSAAVVLPALMDSLRPELRVRAVGLWVTATATGIGVSALALDLCDGAGLTWRAALLVIAVCSLAAALVSTWLAEPPEQYWDGRRVRLMVERHLGVSAEYDPTAVVAGVGRLTMGQQFERVIAPRAMRSLLLLAATFGMFAWSLSPTLGVYFRDRWNLVLPSRDLAYAALMLATAPTAVLLARRAEVAFRRSPTRLVEMGSRASLVAAVALAAAVVSPLFPIAVAMLLAGFAAFEFLFVVAVFAVLVLSEPSLRGHASTVLIMSALLGALVGQQLIATVGDRYGVEWALLFVAAVPLVAGARSRALGSVVDQDLDALAGRLIERCELSARVASGHHLPLLACRHLDFSYGQVQVLFDVSLTVDDGETVALLGTNGAGKSTLLRLISGLSLPGAGSIHYQGEDVTFLGADRRVGLGISQIPGGRAVFRDLSVVDNLRAFGHIHGRNRAAAERGIEATFEALPRLGERRNQPAGTLSGGEQQMLALGKAFILRPRLLLIDELSLGLAPKIVGELLEMVRSISASGTAVVLVEQSVNVALSLVDHAYFMEKGEMRFDGVATDLLDRPDLLRSVFLQGATKGLNREELV